MNRRAWTPFALRGLCSLGLIALLLSRVHWHDLTALLRQAHGGPLALGVLLLGACPFLIAARTRLLLGQWDVALPYPATLALTWLGQFCNTFLPGSTGGDAVKFLRLCQLRPDQKTVGLAALVADRLLALLALMALAGAALAGGEASIRRQILAGSAGRLTPVPVFSTLALAVALGLVGWSMLRRHRARFDPVLSRLRTTAASLRTGLRLTPAAGLALGLALAVHLLAVTSCWLFCRALQVPASFGQVLLVLPLMMVAVLLPLTVNGHGLREYALFFYFERWHLASTLPGAGGLAETVVALSMLMVMSDFFWSLPGGLCLLQGREAPPGPALTQAASAN